MSLPLVLSTTCAVLVEYGSLAGFQFLLNGFIATEGHGSAEGWLRFLYAASVLVTTPALVGFAWLHPRLANSTRAMLTLVPIFHYLSAMILPLVG
jgi:hypothetical protein